MGGFECSTHRDRTGRRLDLIASTKHDTFAREDYDRLMEVGMLTARDGVRWHLIEVEPYRYDFSSLSLQLAAATDTGIEIIWDLFHYGYPDGLDIFSPEFIERFAKFAEAVAIHLSEKVGPRLFICPMNEISFFSWIAGEKGQFYPCVNRRGNEKKKQLIAAAIAASETIRDACPSATIVYTDPAIHVTTRRSEVSAKMAAERYRRAQFHVLDKIVHTPARDVALDLVGLNYYVHNQWHHRSNRKIFRGHKLYRPLHQILAEFYDRYRVPLFIAETGIEDEKRPEWFRYICEEVSEAISRGTPIEGICLYPIANHPGWADNRHCRNGLWDYADASGHREMYEPLAEEIRRQALIMSKI